MSTQLELAKWKYSQELAAYTFEQWRIARQQREAARNSNSSNNNTPGSSDMRPNPTRDRVHERDEQHSAGAGENHNSCAERSRLRVHDFVTSTAPLVNGTA